MEGAFSLKAWMFTFESIYTRKVGGLAEVPPRLANALVEKGIDVEIYTPSHGLKTNKGFKREVFKTSIDGVEYSILEYNAPVKHYIVSGGILEDPLVYSSNLVSKSLVFARVIREYFNQIVGEGEIPDIVHGHDWHSYPALLAINLESTRRGIPIGIVYHVHLLSHGFMDLQEITRGLNIWSKDHVRGKLGIKSFEEYYYASGGWIEKLAALTSDRVIVVSKGYTRDVVRYVGLDNADRVDYVFNASTWTWSTVLDTVSKYIGDRDPFSYEARRLVRDKMLREELRLVNVENPDPYLRDVINRLIDKYGVSISSPFKQDGPLILLTGRSTRQKGIDLLLKSMDKLLVEVPRTRVVLAVIPVSGTEELLREIIEYQLLFPDNLRILPGYIDHEHYLMLYYAASVFLAASRYEPFGLVVLEALSSGTPVAASNTGGFRDLIKDVRMYSLDGTGALFPPLDVDGMIDAVKTVLEIVEDRERSVVFRRRCVEHSKQFSWSSSADKLIKIYTSIKSQAGGRDAL